MQIIHRISVSSSPDVQRELVQLGISVADSGFVSFDVDESNEAWPELAEWVARRRAVDVASTRFSKKEIADARWLELVPDWHHGYPQPNEDVFGFRQATYDLADWCDRCGVGMKQVAPFQMKGEPKWGRKGILQLNWVFDEYFATPDAWALVFKPHGIECRPVLNTKGDELRTVVHLVSQGEVGVVPQGLATEEAACSSCGRTKYLPVARGRFPAMKEEPSTAMVTTKEYFGSGASAHRRVLVSQAVAHSLTAAKLRGASLRPVADRETRS
jgi:hypothetical protein